LAGVSVPLLLLEPAPEEQPLMITVPISKSKIVMRDKFF
jgi:hypothetical protein